MDVSSDEIIEAIARIGGEVTGAGGYLDIDFGDSLTSLSDDEKQRKDIITQSGKEFKVEIPDSQLGNLKTVQELVNYIQAA